MIEEIEADEEVVAFEEKPKSETGTAVAVGVGLLALTGFAVWYMNRPTHKPSLLGPTAPGQPLVRVNRCPEGQFLSPQGQCLPGPR